MSDIQYLYAPNPGMEIIICKHSPLSYPLHNHVSVFTAGIVLDGAIRFTAGQASRVLHPNETFAVPPYTPHSIEALENYSLLSVCLDKKLIHCKGLVQIQKVVCSLIQMSSFAKDMGEQRMAAFLETLNGLFQLTSKESFFKPPLRRLINQLETQPERPYSLDDMSRTALSSKYHLIRDFKQETGLTPHQFQLQNRIRKAQRLLGKTQTDAEAALTAGFFDQSHFIKKFEKVVGMTPTAYKASFRELPPFCGF